MIFSAGDNSASQRLVKWVKRSCVISFIYQIILIIGGIFAAMSQYDRYKKNHHVAVLVQLLGSAIFEGACCILTFTAIYALIRFTRTVNLKSGEPDGALHETYWLTRSYKINVITGIIFIVYSLFLISFPMVMAWETKH